MSVKNTLRKGALAGLTALAMGGSAYADGKPVEKSIFEKDPIKLRLTPNSRYNVDSLMRQNPNDSLNYEVQDLYTGLRDLYIGVFIPGDKNQRESAKKIDSLISRLDNSDLETVGLMNMAVQDGEISSKKDELYVNGQFKVKDSYALAVGYMGGTPMTYEVLDIDLVNPKITKPVPGPSPPISKPKEDSIIAPKRNRFDGLERALQDFENYEKEARNSSQYAPKAQIPTPAEDEHPQTPIQTDQHLPQPIPAPQTKKPTMRDSYKVWKEHKKSVRKNKVTPKLSEPSYWRVEAGADVSTHAELMPFVAAGREIAKDVYFGLKARYIVGDEIHVYDTATTEREVKVVNGVYKHRTDEIASDVEKSYKFFIAPTVWLPTISDKMNLSLSLGVAGERVNTNQTARAKIWYERNQLPEGDVVILEKRLPSSSKTNTELALESRLSYPLSNHLSVNAGLGTASKGYGYLGLGVDIK